MWPPWFLHWVLWYRDWKIENVERLNWLKRKFISLVIHSHYSEIQIRYEISKCNFYCESQISFNAKILLDKIRGYVTFCGFLLNWRIKWYRCAYLTEFIAIILSTEKWHWLIKWLKMDSVSFGWNWINRHLDHMLYNVNIHRGVYPIHSIRHWEREGKNNGAQHRKINKVRRERVEQM